MGQKITFRVYDNKTGEDVTDMDNWYIDPQGDLYFETNDVDTPLMLAEDCHYRVTFATD